MGKLTGDPACVFLACACVKKNKKQTNDTSPRAPSIPCLALLCRRIDCCEI